MTNCRVLDEDGEACREFCKDIIAGYELDRVFDARVVRGGAIDLWRYERLGMIEGRIVERLCTLLLGQPPGVRSQRYRPARQTSGSTRLDTLTLETLSTLLQLIHGYRDQLRASAQQADFSLTSIRQRRKGKREQSRAGEGAEAPQPPSTPNPTPRPKPDPSKFTWE